MVSATRRLGGLVAASVAAALMSTAVACPDDPVTWTFDESTSGEDVFWTSPTAVRPDAAEFFGEYELTGVWVTVLVWGVPVEFEVTDLVPPEYLSGADSTAGPAPLVLFDESVVYPEPPEEPAIAAHILIGLDAGGYGYMEATDIVLGEIDLGFGSVQVKTLRMAGKITVTAIGTYKPSDVTGDGVVDVLDLLAVLAAWGTSDPDADVNDDGIVDVLDLLQVLADWE